MGQCRQIAHDKLPFGGTKHSGYSKEHGSEVLDYYTQQKSVVVASHWSREQRSPASARRRWRGSSVLTWLRTDADVGEGNRAGVDLQTDEA